MKISRNWLQSYFDKPIPPAGELAELLTLHSFEVEGLEKAGDDDVLDVKILPDRAHYCLSHEGVAREISVLTKQPFEAGRNPPSPQASIDTKPTIKIEDPKFCRRYMGRYVELRPVEKFYVRSSRLLEAIGQRAISPIVDATNLVMYDIGQPLHAFDADKVKGAIQIRAAKEGEKIVLLDGRELTLTSADHVIADDLGPLVVAGAKGGKRAEVSDKTTHLIIESANFEPTAVRRTSARHDIRSESSKRYENELTPELTAEGMDNVSALIKELSPEARFGPIVDVYPNEAKQTTIELDPALIEERLGVKVPLDEAKGILERMNIIISEKGKKWQLTIPFNRLDLAIPEDIVEEIGRIYGYEHVKGILPPKADKPVAVLPMFYLCEKIKNVLVAEGFSEVSLYTLVSKGEIETAHPLAKDKAFARANLTDGMTACVEKNALNADLLGLDAIKIFEIGHVFTSKGESAMLSLGAAQVKKVKGLKSEAILTEAVRSLATALGSDIPAPKAISKGVHSVCEISLDEVLKSFKLPPNVSYADLKFTAASANRYKRFSQYPFIVRDIAVFVPESVQADAVWQSIGKGIENAKAAELLARHSLFDTFKKDGKTSYAFRMVFQSMDRTLTDGEANKIMEKIYAEMKEKGWEVR
ncbi:MAG: phenylalanine--tRNA ligase subunit beta [Minisyncoccia bacterium]|jgi:phenylalanyl-tRNA synthetase beta chain